MRSVVRVYLSGSIKKGDGDNRSPDHFWTEVDEAALHAGVAGVELHLLNPAKTPIQRSDVRANFGCDLFLVQQSDVVVVDARREKGIGIGAEMMFAANASIPVITWAPPNTHYRRDFVPNVFGEDLRDWTHPFIWGLSDYVVDYLDDVVVLLNQFVADGRRLELRKAPEAAIAHFVRKHHDLADGIIGGKP